MHIVGDRPGCGGARREVPVTQRAESFTRTFSIGIEPFEGENPRRRRFDCDLHVREARHDYIGAGTAQIHGLASTIDADDETEIPGAPGLHAGDGVFDDDRARRLRFQAARGLEEGIRRRLALQWHPGEIAAIDPSTEPKCIDLKSAVDRGPIAKGMIFEGIYKFDGETLVLTLNMGVDKKRPQKFESDKDSSVVVVTMKREN